MTDFQHVHSCVTFANSSIHCLTKTASFTCIIMQVKGAVLIYDPNMEFPFPRTIDLRWLISIYIPGNPSLCRILGLNSWHAKLLYSGNSLTSSKELILDGFANENILTNLGIQSYYANTLFGVQATNLCDPGRIFCYSF